MELISGILYNAAPCVHFISFGLLLLAGLNIPVSEDIVFIVSSSIAATIVPQNTAIIFLGCFAGAYLSDIMAYGIGRYAGNRILNSERLFRLDFFIKHFSKERIYRLESYFEKYGTKTLFFGRFVPFGIRNVLFMTSGLLKLKMKTFLIVDLAALLCTSTILFSLGYSLGQNYLSILPYLNRYKIIIFSIFLLVVAVTQRKRLFSMLNAGKAAGSITVQKDEFD